MPYTPNIVSTALFETSNVSIFKIPPGPASLSKWNLKDANIVWNGALRLVEQEVIQGGDFAANDPHEIWSQREVDHDLGGVSPPGVTHQPLPPYHGLRAKIELYKTCLIPPSVGSLTTTNKDVPWAEIWFNPSNSIHLKGVRIANNGEETIQITESSRYYKVIAQLPHLGYHPYKETEQRDLASGQAPPLQIGLGLKFVESYQAISFSESLNLYRRRYRNFEDQYEYDLNLYESEKSLKKSSINEEDALFALEPQQQNRTTDRALDPVPGPIHPLADDASDGDEFDEFVSAS